MQPYGMKVAGAAAAAASSYCMLRVAEERFPFADLDRRLGLGIAEDTAAQLWRCTHPKGTRSPDGFAATTVENERNAKELLDAFLTRATANKDGQSRELFTIDQKQSGLPFAGEGAFIRGTAKCGELLTIYHGPVYSPLSGRCALMIEALQGAVSSESIFVMEDSYMIKGLATGGTSESRGALLNHPPTGTKPNAMFVPAVFDMETMSEENAASLRRLNWYAQKPVTFDGKRYIRTALIVALRDVCDEELFLDYDFGTCMSGEELPAWYSECREKAKTSPKSCADDPFMGVRSTYDDE